MKDENYIKNLSDITRYHNRGDLRVRKAVLNKFGGKCAYYGHRLTMESLSIDHVNPLRRQEKDRSKKGANNFSNYFPSCKSCNVSKYTLSIEDWRSEIALKLDRLKKDSSIYRLCLKFRFVKESRKKIVFHFETFGGRNG